MNAPRKAVSGPIAALHSRWQAISPRERRLVLLAGGVVAIGLVVGLLDWSRAEGQRLARRLPRAEASLNQVQEAATEISRLRAAPQTARPDGPALLAAVQASAKSRGAAFVSSCALVSAAGSVVVRGEWPGVIAREPRGSGGFGYDPVFVPSGGSVSAAELTPAEKDAASHRGRALAQLVPALRELAGS